MSTVCVLIAVDVEGALASNNLGGNLYMVDTNKYVGSYGEGTAELSTSLAISDTIVWSVVPIDPATNVQINSFGGQAITSGYITPVVDPLSAQSWLSRFQPPGNTTPGTSFQYTLTFSFENQKTLTFDPYLKVVKPS